MSNQNLFQTKYGHFTADGKEYVITDYKTPKPWVNVISNGAYGLVLSQTGGGFSWLNHSEFNRVNRWHQDMIQDNWGKYFYFKDNATGEVWSPTWMPVKTELDSFALHYGTGYAKFSSVYKGIEVIIDVFVPNDETLEVWSFTVKNHSGSSKQISVFTYLEWCLGTSSDFHREFHKTFIETEFDTELNAIVGRKRLWEVPIANRGHWNIEYPYIGFLSCSKPVESYEADKEKFIGNYGSIANPKAVETGVLHKTTGKWNDSVGCLKITVDVHAEGSSEFAFYLGLKENKTDVAVSLEKLKTPIQRTAALEAVKDRWNGILGTLTVETPDESLNLLVNQWLRYQAIAGRLWGRTAYYQQSGAFGFRDQLQDSMVWLPISPEETKKQIQLHARHQFKDGAVLHWWHPISETGLPTNMTDDLLWLPFLILQYIDETLDYGILDVTEPYYDDAAPVSLYQHSLAAFEKVLTRLSDRGLTLIGAGDWNDGLSAVGLDMKGESVWLTQFFYHILNNFVELCAKKDDTQSVERYREKAIQLKEAFNTHAWDGEWYWGATKDSGEKLGSSNNAEARIWLNTQTWAVLSEISDAEMQHKAMDAVTKYLLKDYGAVLISPAYTKPDDHIGYLTRYAPGRRENGGTYTHAATWAIAAYAKLKDAENALKACNGINPIRNGNEPDRYIAEPFVTPGNIEGPDSPHYGMGGWTWYTGSAAWYQKNIVEWILGIRATRNGLQIDPCIPKHWPGFKVKRLFRGVVYNIEVINQQGTTIEIEVNGSKVEGTIIPQPALPEVSVTVYLKSN